MLETKCMYDHRFDAEPEFFYCSKIYIIYHVNSFWAYSSVALSTFTLLYNYHQHPAPALFHPKLKLPPSNTNSPTSSSKPLVTIIQLPFSMYLTNILHVSKKRDHKRFFCPLSELLLLVQSLQDSSRWGTSSQNFLFFFKALTIFLYVWTIFCSSSHSVMNKSVATFWLWWIMLLWTFCTSIWSNPCFQSFWVYTQK